MITESSDLRAHALTPEQHEQTCGYWYTVTNGALAHTAFATRDGLDRWLRERNLKLFAGFGTGEWSTVRIHGTYRQQYHMSTDEFDAIRPVVATAAMSNGDYTLALIDEDALGIRTVHTLNPNVKSRLVFDYQSTRKSMS